MNAFQIAPNRMDVVENETSDTGGGKNYENYVNAEAKDQHQSH